MKGIIAAAIGISLLFAGCKKNSGNPSGGGGGNTTPGGGSITISGISPQNPHPDNVITITGTGFNADKTKDIVYFGNYDTTKKTFRTYRDGNDQAYKSTIFSASATQLVFKTMDTLSLDLDMLDAPKYRLVPAIQVIANGDTTVMWVKFREMVRVRVVYDPQQPRQAIPDGWPNDSLFIDCNGPIDKTATLKIGGITCAFTPEDIPANTEHETLLHSFLPKSLATTNNDTLMTSHTVELTLADGTVERGTFQFYESPVMKITSMGTALASYSQNTLTSSGGVININIIGKSLKNDATYTVVRNGMPGVVATGTLDVQGFPDQASIVLPSLPSNLYIVSITRKNLYDNSNIFYGTCQINVGP
jgi:hypothetical protein